MLLLHGMLQTFGCVTLQLPDALQIATAISSGCDAFLTNDAALQRVLELRILVFIPILDEAALNNPYLDFGRVRQYE
ncbi:hypothetical protein [Anabaena sp. UHCC 0399]|uniref:hypothetical protein n=1 Tax=Anabaena sp. UHCC 0399 TaxID=3110238 RepID=UPI002B1FBAE4|nr:hypothetical protein [Anabaena sp. UHCC 0399]MEA5567068.1 hypothetical protein [Anabaena sp. UHCC 0399]